MSALERPPLIPLTRPTPIDRVLFAQLVGHSLDTRLLSNAGPHHQQLERQLAAHLGAPQLLLTSSGTAALILALRALGALGHAGEQGVGVERGHRMGGEVITTPLTFAATANAIVRAGGRPVFADVDPATLNLDPAAVEAAITPATKAILAVHLFGVPCDVARLAEVADRHGLTLVYDAAQAFDATVDGRPVTGFGDASALSFHATKIFSTAEGGALVCGSAAVCEAAAVIRNHGLAGDADVVAVGENFKMSELSAAYGLAGWGSLARERAGRFRVAASYTERLRDLPGLALPDWRADGVDLSYFPLRVGPAARRSRDEVWASMGAANITTRRYFPLLSDTKAFGSWAGEAPLEHARRAAAEVLCVPFHGDLADDELDRVCVAIRELLG